MNESASNPKTIRLGDIAKVISGYAFKSNDFKTKGVPVIKIKNIRVGYVDLSEVDFIDPSFQTLPEKYHVKGGDLLISLTGSHLSQPNSVVGRVALHSPLIGNCLLNQRAGKIILKNRDECDQTYLFYVLYSQEKRREIALMAAGAASQANVSPTQVESLEIILPPLETQRKIASILSAYDDLIENNTRRIKILEEMARMIYREWFVNFRFPGHEQVKMVDSPLGMIPEGWEVKTIDDVAVIHRGRSYKSEDLVEDGGLPFLNLKCIDRDGGFRNDGIKRYQGQFKDSQAATTGEIIMAVTDMTQERRLVARAARVPGIGEGKAVISMDLVKISPKYEINSEYLYGLFRFSSFPDEIKQFANGANVLHLKPDHISAFTFSLPPKVLQRQYGEIAKSVYLQCDNFNKKNQNLRQTRDLLLPKLISGEITV